MSFLESDIVTINFERQRLLIFLANHCGEPGKEALWRKQSN